MAPDVFGEMRDAVGATERIRLMCGPVNFVTRDPGVIASAIAPIQLLSGGRAMCGIARGDSAVAMAGQRPQRQEPLDRDLAMLRAYLDRGEVAFPERTSRLEWIGDLAYEPVPIEMVCSGPNAIALAARRADRIGLSVGANSERIAWALRIIEKSSTAPVAAATPCGSEPSFPSPSRTTVPAGPAAIRPRVVRMGAHVELQGQRPVPAARGHAPGHDGAAGGLRLPVPPRRSAAGQSEHRRRRRGVRRLVRGRGTTVLRRRTAGPAGRAWGSTSSPACFPDVERERFAADVMPDLRAMRS